MQPCVVSDENSSSIATPMLYSVDFTDVNSASYKNQLKRELALFQQNIYDFDGKIIGHEILMKVKMKRGLGFDDPRFIINKFERAGKMYLLDQLIFPLALEGILFNGTPNRFYNINISSQSLEDNETIDLIIEQVNIYKPQLKDKSIDLGLEITETARIKHFDRAIHNINRLKAAGIEISIDDFGVGYNAFLLFALFKPDGIKLSYELVRLLTYERAFNTIYNLCDEAQKDGIYVVIEGIENEQMLELAKQLPADLLQGFHFNYPTWFYSL